MRLIHFLRIFLPTSKSSCQILKIVSFVNVWGWHLCIRQPTNKQQSSIILSTYMTKQKAIFLKTRDHYHQLSFTSHWRTCTLVAWLPDAWCFGVIARIGLSGVSMLCVGETAKLDLQLPYQCGSTCTRQGRSMSEILDKWLEYQAVKNNFCHLVFTGVGKHWQKQQRRSHRRCWRSLSPCSRFLVTPPSRLYLSTGRRTDKGLWVNCQHCQLQVSRLEVVSFASPREPLRHCDASETDMWMC